MAARCWRGIACSAAPVVPNRASRVSPPAANTAWRSWWSWRFWSTWTRRAGRSVRRGVRCGCLLPLCKGCFSSVATRTRRPWTRCFPRTSWRGWASAMTRRCTGDALPGLRSVGPICCGRPFVWPSCIRGRRATSDSWIGCWRCTTTRSGRRRTVGWARRGGKSGSPSSRVGCPICVAPTGGSLRPTCRPMNGTLPTWSTRVNLSSFTLRNVVDEATRWMKDGISLFKQQLQAITAPVPALENTR